ncbi:hypothetical protein NE626_12040 [Intestinimonas massiliensis]|uniref:hypothetical protein n=1 Tax=Intestinimonas massiliensis (ex Afouda et al. 2020) TaxID=1673721 RepID=UPI00210B650D|nr:hypothetical protein [Intestinimonas massiliensis (ex Afouda et al. 2020)]MCQ4807544.1 hypothetical protein [Intestinimonas massiliensis (ex Afouda et al. 2020)]
MAVLVAEFFSVIGVEATAPTNMAELIPYLLTVVIGVFLVSGVFRVIGKLAEIFLNWRRW